MPEPAYLTAEPGVHPMVFAPNGSNEQQSVKPKGLDQEKSMPYSYDSVRISIFALPCVLSGQIYQTSHFFF